MHIPYYYQPECNCGRKYRQERRLPSKVLDYGCATYQTNNSSARKCRAEYCLAYCKLFLWEDLSDDSKGNREHGHPNALCHSCCKHEFNVGGKPSCHNTYRINRHYYKQYLFLTIDVRKLTSNRRHDSGRNQVSRKQP